MSYSESNGQVTLTMSREDYDEWLKFFDAAAQIDRGKNGLTQLLNRLNQGNPNYTPYQVEEKK